jgi:hypothetical protein
VLAFEYGSTSPSTKVAAYDFDGTLASPHACMGTWCPGSWEGSGPPVVPGGSVWEGYREWRHTFPNEMRATLHADAAAGYKLVIVSNQSPLASATEGERTLLFGRDVAGRTAEEKQLLWAEKAVRDARAHRPLHRCPYHHGRRTAMEATLVRVQLSCGLGASKREPPECPCVRACVLD